MAACEGMLSVFESSGSGSFKLVPFGESSVAPSVEEFRKFLLDAVQRSLFAQLVIVGGSGDISWTRVALPEEAVKFIVAEVEYPLVSRWFSKSADPCVLTSALEQVLAH